MAHVKNIGLFLLDADVAPTFTPVGDANVGGVAYVKGTQIFYFHTSGTTWVKIDLGALGGSSADGQNYSAVRGDAVEDVAPTAAEVASPKDGDTCSVYLTDGKREFWVYSSGWSKAYVLDSSSVTNLSNGAVTGTTYNIDNSNGTGVTLAVATSTLAGLISAASQQKLDFIAVTQSVNLDSMEQDVADLTTLSGVASNSTDLGTFTGVTISDAATIKQALQELETALELISVYITSVADTDTVSLAVSGGGQLTADVKLSASQNNAMSIVSGADGIKIDKTALTAYDTHAAAHAAVSVGDSYVLTVANLEGVVSDGLTAPEFWRTV